MLGCDSILSSRKGNCEPDQMNSNPFSDILFISSRRDKSHEPQDEDVEVVVSSEFDSLHQKLTELNEAAQSNLTDDLKHSMIAHIATLIEEKIKTTDRCTDCINVFEICKKVEKSYRQKQRPCKSTVDICREADRFLHLQLLKGTINFNTIYYSIINNIEIDHIFVEADFSRHPEHKFYLIRAVIDGYIHIKGTFMARTATKDLHTQSFRYRFRQLVHFYGQ